MSEEKAKCDYSNNGATTGKLDLDFKEFSSKYEVQTVTIINGVINRMKSRRMISGFTPKSTSHVPFISSRSWDVLGPFFPPPLHQKWADFSGKRVKSQHTQQHSVKWS